MPSIVLVVHEQAAVRHEAREWLESAGHRVREADGLELGGIARPDLLLVGHGVLQPLAEGVARIKRHANTGGSRLIVLCRGKILPMATARSSSGPTIASACRSRRASSRHA